MPRKTAGAREWFDQFPPINPPGWDDSNGWCRRHWAPLTNIPDPAQRAAAQQLASLDLMGVFAAALRHRVEPKPVPARYMDTLVRKLSPVCCYVGDAQVQAVILAAILTVADGQQVTLT